MLTVPRSPQGLEISWADVPSHILRLELARRQNGPAKPECGSGLNTTNYNTSLHVGALILILVLSTLACSFPIIVRRVPHFPVPHRFLFLSRHFGTGVLIATAFVHLLPTAFQSMTDPCLPWFWNKGYPAMPGLIAMISVFVVVGIEMFFAMQGAGHVHGSAYDTLVVDNVGHLDTEEEMNGRPNFLPSPHDSYNRYRQGIPGANGHAPSIALGNLSPRPEAIEDEQSIISPASPPEDDDLSSPYGPTSDSAALLSSSQPHQNLPRVRAHSHDSHHAPESNNPHKALLQCLLLEAGILFHSIFIGMALSVSTGRPFLVLLIAISFHQTFEGFALGSRIAALVEPSNSHSHSSTRSSSPHHQHSTSFAIFEPNSPRPWLMALAYGTTTPFGQALGLLIHRLYDPRSAGGLLAVGIMNAISSGLLLFAGLVELLAEDFLSERSYRGLQGRARWEACASVVAGGVGMAIVGAWA